MLQEHIIQIIANAFFRTSYVKVWERYIQKICEACSKLGAPIHEQEITSEFIIICLKALNAKKVDVGLENKILNKIRSYP